MGNYDDIIDLPHHVSETHPPMSRADRAAQFSPFAALTGYDAAVRETARVTERRIELDEGVKAELNARLNCILEHLPEHPQVSITYFMPDEKKSGGAYRTVTGAVRKLDSFAKTLTLVDGTVVSMEEMVHVEGNLFE
ncbi:MAG: hypothetical protein SOW00_06795 [Oscillospiraceae bacterium]|nr:hypothetical protein [Oscillospiraceae bacterium]